MGASSRGQKPTAEPGGDPVRAHPSTPRQAVAANLRLPTPPPVFVPRPRLTEFIDAAVAHPLTLVSAPAGMGKSTLLADWARSRPSVQWPASSHDERGLTLVRHMLDAAHAEQPDAQTLDRVKAEPSRLVDLISRSEAAPDVLVVDNADQMPEWVWPLLDVALTSVPDRVRLVMASRNPLPLSAGVVFHDDTAAMVTGEALRFDDAEAASLITAHAPGVSEHQIRRIQSRAQGWPIEIALEARAIAAQSEDGVGTDPSYGEQFIRDFVRENIYEALPASIRDFLAFIADQDLVTEHEAAVLSDDPNAAAYVKRLAADGLLVTDPAAGSVSWRMLPVLSDVVRTRIITDPAERERTVAGHLRAANYHTVHGSIVNAVRHAVLSGDRALIKRLLIEHGPSLLADGQETAVGEALEVVLDDPSGSHPDVGAVMAAYHLCIGDVDAASQLAEQAVLAAQPIQSRITEAAERIARDDDDPAERALLTDAAMLEAYLARLDCYDRADARRDVRAIIGCSGHPQPGADAGSRRHRPRWPLVPARVLTLLHELVALDLWDGDLAAARAHTAEQVVGARALGFDRLIAAALGDRSLLELVDRNYQTAAASAAECVAVARGADRMNDSSPRRALLVLAWAAWHDVQFDDALRALDDLDRNPARHQPYANAMAFILRSRLRAEAGDVAGARRLLSAELMTVEPHPPFLTWTLAGARADLALIAGDRGEALHQAARMDAAGADADGSSIRWVIADLDGDTEQAQALIERSTRVDPAVMAGAAFAYRARMALLAGDRRSARADLRDALTRIAPQRALYPVARIAAGTPGYFALLEDEVTDPDPHPFALSALNGCARYRRPFADRTFPTTMPSPRSDSAPRPTSGLLTARETDVLRELALGSSYADIAAALYISENTVKTHVVSLYRKLGADRRATALRQARALGLI